MADEPIDFVERLRQRIAERAKKAAVNAEIDRDEREERYEDILVAAVEALQEAGASPLIIVRLLMDAAATELPDDRGPPPGGLWHSEAAEKRPDRGRPGRK
jgi:hypothetical protein